MSTDSTTLDPTPDDAGLDPAEICTLPPEALRDRLAWIRSEILPHAVATERTPDGVACDLEDTPGLAAALDRLALLERECCSGIVLEHHPLGSSGRRRLRVRGIDPQASVFAELEAPAGVPPSLGGRLVKAAGFGTLLGLVVCCGIPIAAAALLGATTAAFLAPLDSPLVIAGSALLFGAAAFTLLGRARGSASAHDRPGSSCGPDC